MAKPALTPGDVIYRWRDTVIFGVQQQHLTVVRMNRRTVTVETRAGDRFRLPFTEIAGCAPRATSMI